MLFIFIGDMAEIPKFVKIQ